jgi:N utilization substance protein A
MSENVLQAMKEIARERGVGDDVVRDALAEALLGAYRSTPGAAGHARAAIHPETGEVRVLALSTPDGEQPILVPASDESEEARVDWSAYPEGDPRVSDVTARAYGRVAAANLRRSLERRLREIADERLYREYAEREGEAVLGVVTQPGPGTVILDLGRVEAILPRRGQVAGETYRRGDRLRAVIEAVQRTPEGTAVVVTRRSERLVEELLRLEVPEIESGLVEIRAIAREPGVRTKVVVAAADGGVSPKGACIGPRGSRVQSVASALRGERVDIIVYDEEPARLIARALEPARVREVLLDDETREATVIVPDEDVSRAVGLQGVNARLAARLTGWRVEITSTSAQAERSAEGGDLQGDRCGALLRSGRRCVNASLPGSRFCGLHAGAASLSQAA